MGRFKLILTGLSLFSFLFLIGSAQAALFCVTANSTGTCADCTATGCDACPATDQCLFQDALTAAETNSAPDTITMAPGIYDANSVGTFTYDPAAENFPLTIQNATDTLPVLTGTLSVQVMHIDTTLLPDDAAADVTIIGLVFEFGIDSGDGAGLEARTDAADLVLQNCSFIDNLTDDDDGGGADLSTDGGMISVSGSLFSGNVAFNRGGGLFARADGGAVKLDGNNFEGNSSIADAGGGANIFSVSGIITIKDNVFSGNAADGQGGGIEAGSATAAINITGNTFSFNAANSDGGAVNAETSGTGTLTFSANTLTDNNVLNDDGAASLVTETGDLTMDSNLFLRNVAGGDGGGFSAETDGGDLLFTNNILANNVAGSDGGGGELEMGGPDSMVLAINNTVFSNQAQSDGGGLRFEMGDDTISAQIYNNIIWGNTTAGNGGDIFVDDGSGTLGASVNLFNNDFTDFFCSGTCSTNITNSPTNIDEDPTFVDVAANDFNLLTGSPAIDTGDPVPPGGLPDPDFAGNPRPAVAGTNPDMGALEFQPPPPPPPPVPPVPPVPPNFLQGACTCHLGSSVPVEQVFSWLGLVFPPVLGLGIWRAKKRS